MALPPRPHSSCAPHGPGYPRCARIQIIGSCAAPALPRRPPTGAGAVFGRRAVSRPPAVRRVCRVNPSPERPHDRVVRPQPLAHCAQPKGQRELVERRIYTGTGPEALRDAGSAASRYSRRRSVLGLGRSAAPRNRSARIGEQAAVEAGAQLEERIGQVELALAQLCPGDVRPGSPVAAASCGSAATLAQRPLPVALGFQHPHRAARRAAAGHLLMEFSRLLSGSSTMRSASRPVCRTG